MKEEPTYRLTWADEHGDAWRVERIAGRWTVAHWADGAWQRIGTTYPNRAAALRAAPGDDRGTPDAT